MEGNDGATYRFLQMIAISTFDGMACGLVALKRLGIQVKKYYASEIDKYAIQVSRKNHPEIMQLGNIEQAHFVKDHFEIQRTSGSWLEDNDKIEFVNLLMGGSPCQGFSIAGEGLAFDDPRSKLFFEFVRLKGQLEKVGKLDKFLLENVQMKKEWQDIISKLLGVSPIVINSSLVSGQHRKRYFWTNIEGIQQPTDKQIFLRDVLQTNVDEKHYLSPAAINRLDVIDKRARERKLGYYNCILSGDDKFLNLDANFFKGPDGKRGVIRHHDGRLRMPTPLECERLQTLPDNYTQGVSDSQRYKMLGNGWTVDVIAHILSYLK